MNRRKGCRPVSIFDPLAVEAFLKLQQNLWPAPTNQAGLPERPGRDRTFGNPDFKISVPGVIMLIDR